MDNSKNRFSKLQLFFISSDEIKKSWFYKKLYFYRVNKNFRFFLVYSTI